VTMGEAMKNVRWYWFLESEVLLGVGGLAIVSSCKLSTPSPLSVVLFLVLTLGISGAWSYHRRLLRRRDAQILEAPLAFKVFWWCVICVSLVLFIAL